MPRWRSRFSATTGSSSSRRWSGVLVGPWGAVVVMAAPRVDVLLPTLRASPPGAGPEHTPGGEPRARGVSLGSRGCEDTAVMHTQEPGRGRHDGSLPGRLGQLASVTTKLLAAEDVAAVTRIVTEDLADAAGAAFGSLPVLGDDDTLALAGIRGGNEGVEQRWATYPVADATPAGDVVRSG